MAARKIENNDDARENAANLIVEELSVPDRDIDSMALGVLGLFDGAQYETSQAKIAGEVRDVQRLVLTTDWQFI